MMRFLFFLIFLFATSLYAAEARKPVEIKNLKTGQIGDKGFAQYDLVGKPGEKLADVSVFIELGSDRYAADKLSLSGDFGKGVSVGVGKKIFWDVLKDMPAGFEGEAVWDVEASGGGLATLVSNVEGTGRSRLRDTTTGMEFEKDGFKFYKDVVVDGRTGLMWARNANIADKKMSWRGAMSWANKLDYGGYRDWRLPTKDELEAFAKRGGKRPSDYFNGTGFNMGHAYWYWSSTTNASGTDGAWLVDLSDGYVSLDRKGGIFYVWPVRAGQ